METQSQRATYLDSLDSLQVRAGFGQFYGRQVALPLFVPGVLQCAA
jgi:hypothetical protein